MSIVRDEWRNAILSELGGEPYAPYLDALLDAYALEVRAEFILAKPRTGKEEKPRRKKRASRKKKAARETLPPARGSLPFLGNPISYLEAEEDVTRRAMEGEPDLVASAELRKEILKGKYWKTTQGVIRVAGKVSLPVEGPGFRGLIIRESNGVSVVQAATGDTLKAGFPTTTNAKLWAFRVAHLADWTQPLSMSDKDRVREFLPYLNPDHPHLPLSPAALDLLREGLGFDSAPSRSSKPAASSPVSPGQVYDPARFAALKDEALPLISSSHWKLTSIPDLADKLKEKGWEVTPGIVKDLILSLVGDRKLEQGPWTHPIWEIPHPHYALVQPRGEFVYYVRQRETRNTPSAHLNIMPGSVYVSGAFQAIVEAALSIIPADRWILLPELDERLKAMGWQATVGVVQDIAHSLTAEGKVFQGPWIHPIYDIAAPNYVILQPEGKFIYYLQRR